MHKTKMEAEFLKKTVRCQYILMQMCYWMLYCVGYSYVTLYLLGQGFSAGNVGVITAVFGAVSALLQPIIGKVADQGGRTGWKPQLMLMLIVAIIDSVLLLVIGGKLIQGLMFGILLMLLSCMMPLVNSANFYYENRGIEMKFGIARGLGSLFYAFISFVIGRLTVDGNIKIVPIFGVIIATLFFIVVFSFPYNIHEDIAKTGAEDVKASLDDGANSNEKSFVRKYPTFCMVLVGFVFVLFFHNIANTYLLQMMEAVGGTSADYGAAVAFSAVLELPAMFGFAWLNKKFSMHTLLSVCGVAFAIKSIFYLISMNVTMMYVTQIWQAVSFALFIPASVYFAQKTVEQKDMVKGQALVTTAITIGAVLGNLIGGFWMDMFGVRSLITMTVVCACIGAIIICIFSRKNSNYGL